MRQLSNIDPSLISIIVPIYNVESFLPECLDSIAAQTYRNWECILVDDGSPDGSLAICEKYITADPRFKLVRRPNGGISAARNTGLEVAAGRYITFIDSDDSARPEMLHTMYDLILEHDADVVESGFCRTFVGGSHDVPLVKEITLLDGPQTARELLRGKLIPCYMWNKLFKREVIVANFAEKRNYEDMLAMSHWLKNIGKMVITPEILYNYRQRANSIVHSYDSIHRLDFLNAAMELNAAACAIQPSLIDEKLSNNFVWGAIINTAKKIARYEADTTTRDHAIEELRLMTVKYPTPRIGQAKFNTWYRSKLLKHTPSLFIKIMIGLKKNKLNSRNRKSRQFKAT